MQRKEKEEQAFWREKMRELEAENRQMAFHQLVYMKENRGSPGYEVAMDMFDILARLRQSEARKPRFF